MSHITTFAQVNDRLDRSPSWRTMKRPAYVLDYMQRFMAYLGNPQDAVQVIHVAGTSGKTSTSYYIAALLHEAGKKVGLSVSPHIHELNERVQVDMVPLPERQYCASFEEFLGLVAKSGVELTRFELLSAFAYWEFARQRVDYAVIEVGMGGELDATNVVGREDKVCVITDIGLDHQRQLGNTLPEIAAKKAGIIHMRNKVFVRWQDAAALEPVRSRARRMQADLHILTPDGLSAKFDFLPLFQRRNFAFAKDVVGEAYGQESDKPLSMAAQLRAARVHIPARMEVLRIQEKTVIIDGAHNEQKLGALHESIRHRYAGKPVAVLAAFKADQAERIEAAASVLTRMAAHIIVTGYGSPDSEPHGEDPQLVAALCKTHGFHSIETITDPAEGWRQLLERPEPVLVVTGSFYLFNEIYPLLDEHVFTLAAS